MKHDTNFIKKILLSSFIKKTGCWNYILYLRVLLFWKVGVQEVGVGVQKKGVWKVGVKKVGAGVANRILLYFHITFIYIYIRVIFIKKLILLNILVLRFIIKKSGC